MSRDEDAEAQEREREGGREREREREARSVQEDILLEERRVGGESMLEDGDAIAQDIFARCQHREGEEVLGGWLEALGKVLSFGGGSSVARLQRGGWVWGGGW